MHPTISEYMYNKYGSINNYLNMDIKYIKYNTFVWLSLDKQIQSGMHNDTDSKILYVLEGKKKVLLLPPSYINDIYLKKMDFIDMNELPKTSMSPKYYEYYAK